MANRPPKIPAAHFNTRVSVVGCDKVIFSRRLTGAFCLSKSMAEGPLLDGSVAGQIVDTVLDIQFGLSCRGGSCEGFSAKLAALVHHIVSVEGTTDIGEGKHSGKEGRLRQHRLEHLCACLSANADRRLWGNLDGCSITLFNAGVTS